MSAATFTPGPWKVERAAGAKGGSPYRYGLYIVDPFGDTARVFGHDEEAQANARLIAAAPELYEALRAYASWFDHHPAFFDAITGKMREAAHMAIAKAEGSAD